MYEMGGNFFKKYKEQTLLILNVFVTKIRLKLIHADVYALPKNLEITKGER